MADHVQRLIQSTCDSIRTGCMVTLVGGFRRGKCYGHDVDLLITHPIVGEEKHLLHQIINYLKENLINYEIQAASNWAISNQKNTMDHFEKAFCIYKLKTKEPSITSQEGKDWRAVRVDLIMVPYNEYPFALLGWTGTKHFEREIRRYSSTEKRMVLNSHGLFSLDSNKSFSATCEEDIFKLLDLDFIPPSLRNF